MSARDMLDLDVGTIVLSTYSVDGFLGIGIDIPGGEAAGTSTFDARFPYGTFGRPRDPDVAPDGTRGTGALGLYAYQNTSRHLMPLDDPRVTPKLPQAPKGTWGAYGDTGREELPVMILDGATGSFAVRVPHSTGGGVASRLLVDVETPGAEEILLAIGGGLDVSIKALEMVVGDAIAALPLAKASAVSGLVAALATFATALGSATTIVQAAAAGTALGTALAGLPPIPTTKLRSE